MGQTQPIQIDQWWKGKVLVACQRYHARLTKEACSKYRRLNPDACRRCPTRYLVKTQ